MTSATSKCIVVAVLMMSLGCPSSPRESEGLRGTPARVSNDVGSSDLTRTRGRTNAAAGPLLMELEVATTDSEGIIEIELLPELAPESVARMVSLARSGHYDGTTFHRVIRGFMIQGGDPNSRDQDPSNDGKGGILTDVPDEFSETPLTRGVVALANRGRKHSNSSQFFILQSDHRELDGRYTAVGRVTRGIEVVDAIANVPTDRVGRWGPKDRPIENVSIRRARILAADQTASRSQSPQPPLSGPTADSP